MRGRIFVGLQAMAGTMGFGNWIAAAVFVEGSASGLFVFADDPFCSSGEAPPIKEHQRFRLALNVAISYNG